jgi:hypothetical protein
LDEGVQILELARNARGLFERQEPCQKRRQPRGGQHGKSGEK